MVKAGLAVTRCHSMRIREKFDVHVGAIQVSGDYALVKAAADKGWLDEKRVVEILTIQPLVLPPPHYHAKKPPDG